MRALFDTNIISEITRTGPDQRVVRCVASVPPEDAFLSVITIGELVYGVKRLAPGKKRAALEAWLTLLEQTYGARILGVDVETTRMWGELTASREAKGRPLRPQDGLIAATALRHGLHLMTRNAADFEHTGVLVINPWND